MLKIVIALFSVCLAAAPAFADETSSNTSSNVEPGTDVTAPAVNATTVNAAPGATEKASVEVALADEKPAGPANDAKTYAADRKSRRERFQNLSSEQRKERSERLARSHVARSRGEGSAGDKKPGDAERGKPSGRSHGQSYARAGREGRGPHHFARRGPHASPHHPGWHRGGPRSDGARHYVGFGHHADRGHYAHRGPQHHRHEFAHHHRHHASPGAHHGGLHRHSQFGHESSQRPPQEFAHRASHHGRQDFDRHHVGRPNQFAPGQPPQGLGARSGFGPRGPAAGDAGRIADIERKLDQLFRLVSELRREAK